MAQTYSIEFKEEACKRVQSGVPAAQVARELGINVNTLYTWMSRFKEHPTEPFVGSGNLHQVLSGRLKGDASVRLKLRGRKHPVSITSHYCLCIQHIGRSSRPPMQIKTQVV